MKQIEEDLEDLEDWDISERADQCCMILIDLYFTVVNVGGEIRLRVSLKENENAYLDLYLRGKQYFEVCRRKDISDTDFWRIKFDVERNQQYLKDAVKGKKDLVEAMGNKDYIVDKKTERLPISMKPEEIAKVKNDYPKNAVIILTEDMYSDGVPEKDMNKNLTGRVSFVDDAGQIHVKWQNGRGLALIPEVDHFQKVEKFTKAYDLMKAVFERMEEDNNEGRPSLGYFDEHYKVISKIRIADSWISGSTYQDTSVSKKELEKQVISGYWVFTHSGHDGDFSARCLLTYDDAYYVVSHLILQDKGVEGMGYFTDILIIHNTEVQFYLSIYNKGQIKL
ncbi:hypothetical protein SAMN02745136_00467 [Anaerocolumna jejuensis DSM 15929]|uniref:DUF4314 domain-containing protein n=1 Tax=Anaerocolumna jejuensis DSM 15929 TaxID=1121322 RepID=A0A1M6KIQ8_9FIRM|nr:DUF4314 domain-containing protein [Anaerocolumna jejuensis]SHJ58789.1 hypothetical protein SAMN02745136_00467 [Anaerocolumna jejuensis DSM 15929]